MSARKHHVILVADGRKKKKKKKEKEIFFVEIFLLRLLSLINQSTINNFVNDVLQQPSYCVNLSNLKSLISDGARVRSAILSSFVEKSTNVRMFDLRLLVLVHRMICRAGGACSTIAQELQETKAAPVLLLRKATF